MPARPKILIIGDAVAPTGFARVIRSIFEPLHNDYELHQLATRYDGGAHDYPWKLYPAGKTGNHYGFDQVATRADQIQPAIVFLLYDIVFQVQYLEHLRKAAAAKPRIVFYSPVESGPIAPEIMQRLRRLPVRPLHGIRPARNRTRVANRSRGRPGVSVPGAGSDSARPCHG